MSTTGSIILKTERLIILRSFNRIREATCGCFYPLDLNGTGMDEDLSDAERKEEELWE